MKIIIDILNQNLWLSTIASLFIGIATDFVWCRWMQNVNNKKALTAAMYSVYVSVIALIYTSIIIANAWESVLSYWLGCFIGTMYAVKYGRE
jgi:hypothetical protein